MIIFNRPSGNQIELEDTPNIRKFADKHGWKEAAPECAETTEKAKKKAATAAKRKATMERKKAEKAAAAAKE